MISLENVSKDFRQGSLVLPVLRDINLTIKDGEFVTLFGPNGSGKTTLLNIISGLEAANSGTVLINGKDFRQSKVGFVFQNYNESLFPWRTVRGNVEFAMEIQGFSRADRLARVNDLLEKVGLSKYSESFLYNLSGGQKQLVAICRALAYNPNFLLMDEPFSSLDYSTTKKMEMELLDVWQEKKLTTLFVSHDIDEAILLADRVAVLSQRPSVVKQVFEVNLSRPRTLGMLSTEEFFKIRNMILSTFVYE